MYASRSPERTSRLNSDRFVENEFSFSSVAFWRKSRNCDSCVIDCKLSSRFFISATETMSRNRAWDSLLKIAATLTLFHRNTQSGNVHFLAAFSHLYKRTCLSVGRLVPPSVGLSVRPSIGHTRVEFLIFQLK